MVTVFTGPGCGKCVVAKAQLRKRGVEFEEVPAEGYVDLLRSLGLMNLPVVLAGDEDVISGYSEGEMDWMLRNAIAA